MKHSLIRATTGTYQPGAAGNNWVRKVNTETAFNACPRLQKAIEEDEISRSFMEHRLLRYDQKMLDGFRARFGNEVILVDAKEDMELSAFLDSFRFTLTTLPEGSSLMEKIKCLVQLVWQCAGGQVAMNGSCDDVNAKLKDMASKYGKYADVPIGALLGGKWVGRPEHKGFGICRHRSILFKYTCDKFDLTPCALLDGVVVPAGIEKLGLDISESRKAGQAFDHMWNLIWVDEEPLVVDCMAGPEAISDGAQLSEHYMKYHRIGGRNGLKSLRVPAVHRATVQAGQEQTIAEDESAEEQQEEELEDESDKSEDMELEICAKRAMSQKQTREQSFSFQVKESDYERAPKMMEGAARVVGLELHDLQEEFIEIAAANGEVLPLDHDPDPKKLSFPLRVRYAPKDKPEQDFFAPGEPVQVWSKDAGSWQSGVVVEVNEAPLQHHGSSITVEYNVGSQVCRKTMLETSKSLKLCTSNAADSS